VVGRRSFAQGRWDLPRHGSHVAQLWTLGGLSRVHPMDTFFEIRGSDFDVEDALRPSTLSERAKRWRRGESVGSSGKHVFRDSGFSVCIGGGDECDLDRQVADAMEFLRVESSEIRRLRALPEIEKTCLRFGEVWPKGIFGRSPLLPSQLLLACGQLGLDIVLCQYLETGISDDDKKST